MKKLNFAFLGLLLISSLQLFSQQENQKAPNTFPAQLTFIHPLGTHGMNAPQVTNCISLNLLAGYNGGVSGIEAGCFSNTLKNDLCGAQFAGFSNQIMGRCKGVQAAGFSNFTRGRINGAQISGFLSFALDTCQGVQVSGFSNLAIKRVEGAQISGFFNFAHQLKGVQIGVVNYCDTVERGIPIGFISIVKHGYQALEFSTDETLNMQASYKTGVKRFYNIFSLGARPNNSNTLLAFGYGIGTNVNLIKRCDLQFELASYHINRGDYWVESLSMLNKLRTNLSIKIGNHLSVFGGVSFNVYLNDKREEEDNRTSESIVNTPNKTYTSGNQIVKLYSGFTAGIRFE